jgi:Dolichyl-phosphate-mannose-protein mannosyltransferase
VVGRLTAPWSAAGFSPGGWWARRGVRLGLAAVLALLALGLRVGQVERTASYRPMNDARAYLTFAREITQHGAYVNSNAVGAGAGGSIGPTAYFPPGFPYFLAAVDLIDGDTTSGTQAVHAARLATAVLGAGAVVLLGLVALEAFGEAVALVAMLIGAVYPPLIELSAAPYSENLLIVLELAAVWAALRARRAPSPFPLLVTAGVFTGLATVTHQNGLVILLPLIFAALSVGLRWSDRRAQDPGNAETPQSPQNPRSRWTRALAAPAVLIAATALTIAPWTIRNAITLHRFVPVSDETGITLAGTYNPTSAADPQIPYKWIYFGRVPAYAPIARATHTMTEPAVSSRLTSAAFHYIGDHPLAPLQVAYHNLRRLVELEGSAAWHDSAASIGVAAGTARIGIFAFWVVALLAAAGLVTRRVRRAPEWLWAIPILLAWSVLLVNSETPRFRSPIDPYLILLASCALVAAAARVRPRLSRANTQAPSPA